MTAPFDPDKPEEYIKDGMERVVDGLKDSFNKFKTRMKEGGTTVTAEQKLFRALRLKNEAETARLLKTGANPNQLNEEGDRPLHVAARAGAVKIAQLLLDAGANAELGRKESPDETPLAAAISFRQTKMAQLLARHGGYRADENGWTPLHRAAEKDEPEVIAALLAAGANGNELTANGATPLLIAIRKQRISAIDRLLQDPAVAAGINVFSAATDPCQRTAFQLAVECGLLEQAQRMIGLGAFVEGPDAKGTTPLMSAAAVGDLDMARLLVRHGAIAKAALVFACASDRMPSAKARGEMISFLIQQGADANARDPQTGLTPLAAASRLTEGTAALERLLAEKADTEVRDQDGLTPLFHATLNADTAALRVLLDAGANPNARHLKDGSTPLHHAVESGNLASVKLLVEAGASPMLVNLSGLSPLTRARVLNRTGMAALLTETLEERFPKKAPHPGPAPG